jgi:hypothetical protein
MFPAVLRIKGCPLAAQAFHCTTGLKLFHLPPPVFFILAPLLDRLKKIMRGLLFIDRRVLRNKTGLRSFGDLLPNLIITSRASSGDAGRRQILRVARHQQSVIEIKRQAGLIP